MDEGPDHFGRSWQDTITVLCATFMLISALLLAHISSKAKASASGNEAPGNVMFEVRWPDKVDADVDLWVQGPGDVPVGYSNKGGVLFNLLRDDLGTIADVTDLNYEVAFSRGLYPGLYVANLHLFRNTGGTYPVEATVVASVKYAAGQSAVQLATTRILLRKEGQETTAMRFRLDGDGKLVPGSVDNVQTYLRSAGAK